MDARSLRQALRRLLVGPGRAPLRVGVPGIVAAAAVAAVSTASVLASSSGGGVYFPLDAAAVGLVASALYAGRYRGAAVCVAIGVAAFAGSSVGFHALHGDDAVLRVLARFVRDGEAAAFGAFFGAVGGAFGGLLAQAYRLGRRRAA